MPAISNDDLKLLSVGVVEDFLNNKVPLSAGLAKQAAAADLNAEQVQRAVEVVNTIAYLKVLGMADDRTVEFPLAKFAEVMSLAALPDGIKAAGWEEEKVTTAMRPVETADAPPSGEGPVLVDEADKARAMQEKRAWFDRAASQNAAELERLRLDAYVVTDRLGELAATVRKDGKGLDKLASVSEGDEFGKLSILVTGKVQPRRDFGGHGLFKEADLRDVNALAQLYKQAQQLVAEMARRSALDARAKEVRLGIAKEAGVFGAMGNVAGRIAGAPIGMAARVAATPFREAGRVAGNAIGSGMSRITGKPFTPKPMGLGTKLGIGGVGLAASVGLDAAMYDPGRDASTGRSNDVWTALQRE